MTTKEDDVYICDFCGAEYMTRSGATKHEKKCDRRTDATPVETDEKAPIALFRDTPDEKAARKEWQDASGRDLKATEHRADEDRDEYVCPVCGYARQRPFIVCPECGEELSWPTETGV